MHDHVVQFARDPSLAVRAALAGAWLGLKARADLPALITSAVGAIAGANLTLLVLDV
jgi:hypothetical protein